MQSTPTAQRLAAVIEGKQKLEALLEVVFPKPNGGRNWDLRFTSNLDGTFGVTDGWSDLPPEISEDAVEWEYIPRWYVYEEVCRSVAKDGELFYVMTYYYGEGEAVVPVLVITEQPDRELVADFISFLKSLAVGLVP